MDERNSRSSSYSSFHETLRNYSSVSLLAQRGLVIPILEFLNATRDHGEVGHNFAKPLPQYLANFSDDSPTCLDLGF